LVRTEEQSTGGAGGGDAAFDKTVIVFTPDSGKSIITVFDSHCTFKLT